MPAPPKRIHLVYPMPLHEQLAAVATANDRTVTAEIRVAIREHVRRQRPKQRAAEE